MRLRREFCGGIGCIEKDPENGASPKQERSFLLRKKISAEGLTKLCILCILSIYSRCGKEGGTA